ncbi:hypothetical protein BG004_004860 [Podila humilis]|nr:hypothetical protein BG004_004860 [Podila humilis]
MRMSIGTVRLFELSVLVLELVLSVRWENVEEEDDEGDEEEAFKQGVDVNVVWQGMDEDEGTDEGDELELESQEVMDELSDGIENDEDMEKEGGVVVIGVKEVHEEDDKDEEEGSELPVWISAGAASVEDEDARSKQEPE